MDAVRARKAAGEAAAPQHQQHQQRFKDGIDLPQGRVRAWTLQWTDKERVRIRKWKPQNIAAAAAAAADADEQPSNAAVPKKRIVVERLSPAAQIKRVEVAEPSEDLDEEPLQAPPKAAADAETDAPSSAAAPEQEIATEQAAVPPPLEPQADMQQANEQRADEQQADETQTHEPHADETNSKADVTAAVPMIASASEEQPTDEPKEAVLMAEAHESFPEPVVEGNIESRKRAAESDDDYTEDVATTKHARLDDDH